VLDNATVCVGGEGDNTYSVDYPLLIDLGGEDTYVNSAGGASPLAGQQPVSVVLDMAGDDSYQSKLGKGAAPMAAQGAGVAGVGFLVDVEGDDSYVAEAAQDASILYAQGSAQSGVGVRVDLAGADEYQVTNAGTAEFLTSNGQAAADTGGIAVSFDGGTGNDTYRVEAVSKPQEVGGGQRLGSASVYGFGAATSGAALWADGGGTDEVSAEALAGSASHHAGRIDEPFPSAEVSGIGFALGGTGIAIAGEGATKWNARAQTLWPVSLQGGNAATVLGFGLGSRGLGAVHDNGGNDSYVAEAISEASATASAGASCDCQRPKAKALAGRSVVRAQGAGANGIGILRDASGDDRFDAIAISRAKAQAMDGRSG
jgi:hypothetical protein